MSDRTNTASRRGDVKTYVYLIIVSLIVVFFYIGFSFFTSESEFQKRLLKSSQYHLATINEAFAIKEGFLVLERGMSDHAEDSPEGGLGDNLRKEAGDSRGYLRLWRIAERIEKQVRTIASLQRAYADPGFQRTVERTEAQAGSLIRALREATSASMPDRAVVLDEFGHLNFILSQLSKLHRIAYEAAEQSYLQDVARARQRLLLTGLATAGLVAVLIVLMLRQISQTLRRLAETERELQSLNAGLEQRVEARSMELAAAQEELLRKSRLAALGQLTGTVSHELRNPLGALRSSIAAIRRIASGETPAMHQLVEIADRSVTRCDELISDLLEYSRVRVLHREETDLDAWLTGVLDEIALPETVELGRDLACDRALLIDPERLRRVVINVVENACQAMTAGDDRDHARTGRLAISTRISETRAELRVADTGPGMDEETLGKIFEPLYSTKAFGVGLGLTVVRQIMEQHEGGIEIESTPGKGTEVVLWLPLPVPARRAAS